MNLPTLLANTDIEEAGSPDTTLPLMISAHRDDSIVPLAVEQMLEDSVC